MDKDKKKYQDILKGLPENQFACGYNVLLDKHSTWRIGGPADVLLQPFNKKCLQTACGLLSKRNIPMVIIGKGSNLLFDDTGFRGVVIKLSRLYSNVTVEENTIFAEAGLFLPKLSYLAANHGLTGLEHICGIPGTIGGLVYMNGGSLDRSIGENVVSVETINSQGEERYYLKSECNFSYRESIFQTSDDIITGVHLECKKGATTEMKDFMREILNKRKRQFPLALPNCGSVFKIHPELLETFGPPGKIIDDAGLKGLRVGDAEVSHKHANFIVNKGKATSADVILLAQKVRQHIFKQTGTYLKSEVRYISPDGKIRPLDKELQKYTWQIR